VIGTRSTGCVQNRTTVKRFCTNPTRQLPPDPAAFDAAVSGALPAALDAAVSGALLRGRPAALDAAVRGPLLRLCPVAVDAAVPDPPEAP
jgi:hypothetical protein